MDDGIMNLGSAGSDPGQALPYAPTIVRKPQVVPPLAGATSPDLQKKPEALSETPEGKAHKEKALVQEVAFANAIGDFLNQKVSFSYNTDIDQIVVKVTKGDTEEVIRQMPSKEMVELMTRFRKDFRGLIFNRTG